MSKLIRDDADDPIQTLRPNGTYQKVAIGAASAASAAFTAGVSVIRIVATVNCWYEIGSAPTATTSKIYLPAGAIEMVGVKADGTDKIAVIQDSGAGSLSIAELF